MKTQRLLILLTFAFLVNSITFAEPAEITRKRATLREGPGSFFPAIAELQQGKEV